MSVECKCSKDFAKTPEIFSVSPLPATKESVGLTRRDGKGPDGTTQIPWRSGKLSVWNVTSQLWRSFIFQRLSITRYKTMHV